MRFAEHATGLAHFLDLLPDITKASSSTDSFIVVRLIPAGTGMAFHQARKTKEEMDESERRAIAMQESEELAAAQLAAVDAKSSSTSPDATE